VKVTLARVVISCSSVRGYVVRSSCGANCAGFTNMERTVRSFSARDVRTTCFRQDESMSQ